MGDKLYLLVCEGPTDILVIDKIAKKISEDINTTIRIRELSPQKDATTNRYPSHGWKEVRRWCKVYGKTIDVDDNPFAILAQKKNWKTLLKTSNAHGLIIQMDTDIVQYITDLTPNYRGTTKNERKRFAKKAILNWLGEDTLPTEIYLLLSTTSTETWILATHDRVESVFDDLPNNRHLAKLKKIKWFNPVKQLTLIDYNYQWIEFCKKSNFDYEDIEDVIERLFTLGYCSYIDNETGKKKFSKSKYMPYAQKIVDNLEKVCLECEEADKLCQEFMD